jgi:hypothetical protein
VQSGVGAEQLVPQLPQLVAVVTSVSQPLAGLLEQCARPSTQAPVKSHMPFTQRTAEAFTPGSLVQSLAQAPQWRGSLASDDEQLVGEPGCSM